MCRMGRYSAAERVRGGTEWVRTPTRLAVWKILMDIPDLLCVISFWPWFRDAFSSKLSFLSCVGHRGHTDLILQDTEWQGSQEPAGICTMCLLSTNVSFPLISEQIGRNIWDSSLLTKLYVGKPQTHRKIARKYNDPLSTLHLDSPPSIGSHLLFLSLSASALSCERMTHKFSHKLGGGGGMGLHSVNKSKILYLSFATG